MLNLVCKLKERMNIMNSTKVKTDCFAYHRGECTILYELVCSLRNCSFYKTCKQYNSDKLKYSYKGRENY